MKKTFIWIMAVSFLFFGALSANEKNITFKKGPVKSLAVKAGPNQAGIQNYAENEADVVLLSSYLTNDRDEIGNCIELYATSAIDFNVEYISYTPKWVRFHYIWTGPEYYTYTTDWVQTGYYEFSSFSISTGTNWIPGTYKMVILLEHEYGAGAGMQTVAESHIVFY